jgi:hypothetical protein
VTGTLSYGGALSVVSFGGFTVESLDLGESETATFTLFTAVGATNDFSSVEVFGNSLAGNNNEFWTTGVFVGGYKYDFNTENGVLSITAIPESRQYAVATMILLGAAICLRRRRAI